ncbi:pantetheine-phosphate adenylyltransferase [Floccifex sp.]|uniref:pantetheine-phosphate adenylyltransferase n=1 Tax=Floccifex sp. TaxID=2815810 RepID=UPI002A752410|nr:pantetheine-phosphate adenylyltransferase [Floccifex sp.]MDD7280834.1 pantetheine-phosphate adenylyltransferase [Erysipelotrichaceae bacterium]MDY2958179.1 pantetheine-phosphate adenylyltransferase [Floccifex sp.]
MSIAAFCGSFDPITKGHLDIIERASKMFEEVYVFILSNSNKNSYFSFEQRMHWLEQACAHLENVHCQVQEGLSVEACKSVNATVLVRGIRNTVDFEYEKNIASMNLLLDESIETICLFTRDEYAHCSSSNVKELLKYGKDISRLVPECVAKEISK